MSLENCDFRVKHGTRSSVKILALNSVFKGNNHIFGHAKWTKTSKHGIPSTEYKKNKKLTEKFEKSFKKVFLSFKIHT